MERFVFRETPVKAALADILRVHDFLYVDGIKKACDGLKASRKLGVYKYDTDTVINHHTFNSSLYAVGCIIDAVDQVMMGNYNNALCLVRPPGHHAGYFGKVE